MSAGAERTATRLSVELEAKLLARLRVEWRGINYVYFRGSLRVPVIQVVEASAELGCWYPEVRSLEIARALVLDYDWGEVLETLKRELVQQYVDEQLHLDERRHGPTFRRICRRFGIRLRLTGAPRAARVGEGDATSRVVNRIHKLLALAGSPNRHEAETAAITARRLMLKFNISGVESARSQAGEGEQRRGYGFRHLGRPRGRLEEHDRRLAKILNDYFFVESAWVPVYEPRKGRRGSVLEICGLEANLLMAEHVHDFTSRTAARLWSEYARETPELSARDRLAFLAGVMKGFETKLEAQDERLSEQGLVWVPAPELGVYFRRRNPRLAYVQGDGAARNEAYEQGSRAGRAIVLSQPVAGTRSGGPPKALKAGG